MDNYSWKNLKRGVRRHYTKKYKGVRHPCKYGSHSGWKSPAMCTCWLERHRDSCDRCKYRMAIKSGEASMNDDFKENMA